MIRKPDKFKDDILSILRKSKYNKKYVPKENAFAYMDRNQMAKDITKVKSFIGSKSNDSNDVEYFASLDGYLAANVFTGETIPLYSVIENSAKELVNDFDGDPDCNEIKRMRKFVEDVKTSIPSNVYGELNGLTDTEKVLNYMRRFI